MLESISPEYLTYFAANELSKSPQLYRAWQKQGWEIYPVNTELGIGVLINTEASFYPMDDTDSYLRNAENSANLFWDIDIMNGWHYC